MRKEYNERHWMILKYTNNDVRYGIISPSLIQWVQGGDIDGQSL